MSTSESPSRRYETLINVGVLVFILLAPQLGDPVLKFRPLIVSLLLAVLWLWIRLPEFLAYAAPALRIAWTVTAWVSVLGFGALLALYLHAPSVLHDALHPVFPTARPEDTGRIAVGACLILGFCLSLSGLLAHSSASRERRISEGLSRTALAIHAAPVVSSLREGDGRASRPESIAFASLLDTTAGNLLELYEGGALGQSRRFAIWLLLPVVKEAYRAAGQAPLVPNEAVKRKLAEQQDAKLSDVLDGFVPVRVWNHTHEYDVICRNGLLLPVLHPDARGDIVKSASDAKLTHLSQEFGEILSRVGVRPQVRERDVDRVSNKFVRRCRRVFRNREKFNAAREALTGKTSAVGLTFAGMSYLEIPDCDREVYAHDGYLNLLDCDEKTKKRIRFRSAISMTLRSKGHKYGVLMVTSCRRNAFGGGRKRLSAAIQPMLAEFLAVGIKTGALPVEIPVYFGTF